VVSATFVCLVLATAFITIAVLLRRLQSIEATARERELEHRADREAHDDVASAVLLAGELCDTLASSLTIILCQCELARIKGERSARLDHVESAARALDDTLSRYRRISHVCTGERVAVDSRRCVRSALESMRELADDSGVGLHFLVDAAPELQTDPVLLGRAVRQMLRASIASSHLGHGDITLALGLLPVLGAPTHLGVCIADDGPGFDLTRGSAGAGSRRLASAAPHLPSGYRVVETMARALGGEMIIESAPGKGTLTTLKLPLEHVLHRAPRTATEAPAEFRPAR